MRKIYLAFISTFFIVTMCQAQGMVICNSSAGQDSLSKQELSKIFLGKQGSWGNDTGITTCYQTGATDSAKTFFSEYVGKKPKKYKKYWLKKVFSGNGTAPRTFDNADALISYVQSTKGAIAYIDTDSTPSGVTVLSIDGVKTF